MIRARALGRRAREGMRFPELVEGHLIQRENRFRAAVEVLGQVAGAHVANSGRLRELLTSGRRVWLADRASNRPGPPRKTAYDLVLVEAEGTLVSIDARVPNRLFSEALAPLWGAGGEVRIVPEVRWGESRLDFRLALGDRTSWVEVKSVTLARGGVALFPDAPTARGRRHLDALAEAVTQGDKAAVVFIVQRGDADRFSPNGEADPAFAQRLFEVASLGVAVKAFRCAVSLQEIIIAQEIPIQWPA